MLPDIQRALHLAADAVLSAGDALDETGLSERFFAALGDLELNVARLRWVAESLRGTA